MTKVLWQWNKRLDRWEWVAEATEEMQRSTLRGYKRRNPRGTQFRWRTAEDGAPKRYRQRAVKEATK